MQNHTRHDRASLPRGATGSVITKLLLAIPAIALIERESSNENSLLIFLHIRQLQCCAIIIESLIAPTCALGFFSTYIQLYGNILGVQRQLQSMNL